MLYQAYQAQADGMVPMRILAEAASGLLLQKFPGGIEMPWARALATLCQLMARAELSHRRPEFEIATVRVGNADVPVSEESIDETPFCTLLHFKKEVEARQPRVLLIAPMSGHFATLLRDTVRTMLADHDVYVTDWRNAREIPLRHGEFGFDAFTEHIIRFLEKMGEGAHVLAVCQPCVPALAATAIMAEDGNPAAPRSMILMAGPVDTRVNPTKVDEFATAHSMSWFESNVIGVVPQGLAGVLRRVYPGFLQLIAFMSMNIERHIKSFQDVYNHTVKGEFDKAETIRKFYEEYFAVMDLPAEFYLETLLRVFKEHDLARGVLRYHGRKVEPRAIRRAQLLTIEGDRDDICSVGQTLAAQELCSGIARFRKRHYVQPGAGHYGVFSGKRWSQQIYPLVRDVIHASD
jgi:poly(3-hydroxybutyrate) depolymerase